MRIPVNNFIISSRTLKRKSAQIAGQNRAHRHTVTASQLNPWSSIIRLETFHLYIGPHAHTIQMHNFQAAPSSTPTASILSLPS